MVPAAPPAGPLLESKDLPRGVQPLAERLAWDASKGRERIHGIADREHHISRENRVHIRNEIRIDTLLREAIFREQKRPWKRKPGTNRKLSRKSGR